MSIYLTATRYSVTPQKIALMKVHPTRTVPLPGSPSRSGVSDRRRSRRCTPLFRSADSIACVPPRMVVNCRASADSSPPQNGCARSDQQRGHQTMVKYVWLTIRSIPFVRWPGRLRTARSWSRMAALILFCFSACSALTDFS